MTTTELNRLVRDHIGPPEGDWVTLANTRRKLRTLLQRLQRLAEALQDPLTHSRRLAEASDAANGWELYVLDHIERIGAALEYVRVKQRARRLGGKRRR